MKTFADLKVGDPVFICSHNWLHKRDQKELTTVTHVNRHSKGFSVGIVVDTYRTIDFDLQGKTQIDHYWAILPKNGEDLSKFKKHHTYFVD